MKKIAASLLFLIFCNSSRAQSLKNSGPERIAILDFKIIANTKDSIEYNWMSHGFAETLSDAFSRIPQFSVIERTQLDKIINEQQFQKTDRLDTSSIVKFGKFSGVKKVLIGSYQIATGSMLVNMRIVNVETGEISRVENLPIIKPIDSVLFLQGQICSELLQQFRITDQRGLISDIKKVTSASTKSIKAYEFLNKGLTFYNNNQYPEALDMYNLALGYDKKYPKAYYRRGLTNYALNQYKAAADDFRNSNNFLRKDSIYLLIADAYQKQGLNKKAYEYLKKAEKINPSNNSIKKSLKLMGNPKQIIDEKKSPNNTRYETIYEFNNGIAKVSLNQKYGFIDTLNNTVIPIIYEQISDFKNGIAIAKSGGKWGYINSFGAYIIPPIYTKAQHFDKNGLAHVEIKDKEGIIDSLGKIILPIEYNYIYREIDGLFVVSKYKNILEENLLYGVFDRNGKEILPLIYNEIQLEQPYDMDFKNLPISNIKVLYNRKWGVVNRRNEIIIPFKYDNSNCIRNFSNGLAAVKVNEKWGFVNNRGLEVIEPQFERVDDFSSNLSKVKLRGKWGLIDTSNVIQIPISYDKLYCINIDYWAAQKGTKWGIIDSKNKTVCSFTFDAITTKDAEIEALISLNTESLSQSYSYYETSFSTIEKSNFIIRVKKDNKEFMINEQCKCVSGCLK